GDAPCRGNPTDLVGDNLREPEFAVRASRDTERIAGGGRRRELIGGRDDPSGSDPADLADVGLREPEIAIGAERDTPRQAVRRQASEFADPGGRHAALLQPLDRQLTAEDA